MLTATQQSPVQDVSLQDAPVVVGDYSPQAHDFRCEVLAGLTQPEKSIPSKYFYDEPGSLLFDAITELEEYYPTRTELGIMAVGIHEMAWSIGPEALLIEYGSGTSMKTRFLLEASERPAGYVPIDISREHLLSAADRLRLAFPNLDVLPVCADYTRPFALPTPARPARRKVVYFPGSTIGNFHPSEAALFLTQAADLCGAGGGLIIGVDLRKDSARLERAYDDAQGVTAAFNLNLLTRINAELGADFDVDQFAHRAFYNPFRGRIEMHLVSCRAQTVHIADVTIPFLRDESIHTECSYKYELSGFAHLAASAGWRVEQVWTDDDHLFSVQYLTVA